MKDKSRKDVLLVALMIANYTIASVLIALFCLVLFRFVQFGIEYSGR
jgi:hypothetical protein